MTTQETECVIKVMQAFVDGKQIQSRGKRCGDWKNVHHASGFTPGWNWEHFEYRVAPEPEKKIPAPAEILYAAVHIDDGRMYAADADPSVAEDICKYGKNYRVVKYVPEVEYFKDYKIGDYAKVISLQNTDDTWLLKRDEMPRLLGKVMRVRRPIDFEGHVCLDDPTGDTYWFWDPRDLIPACKP